MGSREAFKRPEPPLHTISCLGGGKRKSGGNNFMVERSVSLQERAPIVAKPTFHRSQSTLTKTAVILPSSPTRKGKPRPRSGSRKRTSPSPLLRNGSVWRQLILRS